MSLSAARGVIQSVDLKGKTAIVVGGTSGIGKSIALRLAQSQASVTIVGRSRERGEEIVKEMESLASVPESGARFGFVECDCYLVKNVNSCVETIKEERSGQGLDYLVVSQGMATIQGFTPSPEEGLDQKLTLHYYSRLAFIRGLLPLLRDHDARVLSVLSAGVHSQYAEYKSDPELSLGAYSIKNVADAAGFYNDIMVDSLSREEPSITFMHSAPGFIATNWGTEMPAPIRWCVRGMQAIGGRSEADCGEFMTAGLVNPAHQGGFVLFDQYGAATPKVTAIHDQARDAVWAHTAAVLAAGKAVASAK